jgi:hypothetical protein
VSQTHLTDRVAREEKNVLQNQEQNSHTYLPLSKFVNLKQSQSNKTFFTLLQMTNQTGRRKLHFILVSAIRNTDSVGSLQAGPISRKLRTCVFNK